MIGGMFHWQNFDLWRLLLAECLTGGNFQWLNFRAPATVRARESLANALILLVLLLLPLLLLLLLLPPSRISSGPLPDTDDVAVVKSVEIGVV